jgi:hypothetical protein
MSHLTALQRALLDQFDDPADAMEAAVINGLWPAEEQSRPKPPRPDVPIGAGVLYPVEADVLLGGGSVDLDTAVFWFREATRTGLRDPALVVPEVRHVIQREHNRVSPHRRITLWRFLTRLHHYPEAAEALARAVAELEERIEAGRPQRRRAKRPDLKLVNAGEGEPA